jgi:hypothetical protein
VYLHKINISFSKRFSFFQRENELISLGKMKITLGYFGNLKSSSRLEGIGGRNKLIFSPIPFNPEGDLSFQTTLYKNGVHKVALNKIILTAFVSWSISLYKQLNASLCSQAN